MLRKLLALTLTLGLMAPAMVFAAPAPKPAPAPAPAPPEPHPAIRAAIEALEKAKYDLNHANHDFGGHRAEALEACDNAIKQLKIALQYDKH